MNTKHVEAFTRKQLEELALGLVKVASEQPGEPDIAEQAALVALLDAKCVLNFGLVDMPQKYSTVAIKSKAGVIAVVRRAWMASGFVETNTIVSVGGRNINVPTNTPEQMVRLFSAIGAKIEAGTAVTILARAESAFSPLVTFEQIVMAAVEIMERDKTWSAAGVDEFDEDTFADYVAANGHGDATEAGIKLGRVLVASGDSVTMAALEVVYQGLYHSDEAS